MTRHEHARLRELYGLLDEYRLMRIAYDKRHVRAIRREIDEIVERARGLQRARSRRVQDKWVTSSKH